jgi:hypothetical protein
MIELAMKDIIDIAPQYRKYKIILKNKSKYVEYKRQEAQNGINNFGTALDLFFGTRLIDSFVIHFGIDAEASRERIRKICKGHISFDL